MFDSSNIIGRKSEIDNLFRILRTHSVVLCSHRRMGKTLLLKKMTVEHPEDFLPVFFIVEGKSNPEEFLHDLFVLLKENGLISESRGSRILSWWERNFAGKEIQDMKLPSFRPHWKEALRNLIEDVLEKNQGKTVLIMIDEFPWMLYKFIREYDLQIEAIEMLDSLREIRQLYGDKGIRFIFCGSIGFNIVLSILRKEYHYAGEPINDMYSQILDAMTKDDAIELAYHLIETKKLNTAKDLKKSVSELCYQSDYLPFYIDLILNQIELNQAEMSSSSVAQEIEKLLNSPANQGQFNHFSDRINNYYEDDTKLIAKKILNWLARQPDKKVENDIYNIIASTEKVQLEEIKSILKQLFEDLYLERSIKRDTRHYNFKYTLLKRWWSINLS